MRIGENQIWLWLGRPAQRKGAAPRDVGCFARTGFCWEEIININNIYIYIYIFIYLLNLNYIYNIYTYVYIYISCLYIYIYVCVI